MKSGRKSIILLFIIGMLNLCACNQEIHKPITMVRAEKIMDENPDSARRLLAGLKTDMKKENKATQMYYNLLTVKADDKCFIPHTSDSLMLELVKYYKHHGEPQQLIQAYYYLASVYRDLNFTAQALENFNKALNLPDKNCNLYKARAANQIGYVYMYQNMYKEARPYFEKTYQYAKLIPDTVLMVYALRDKGRSYQAQKKTEKAINTLKDAISLAERSRNRQLQNQAWGELSISYQTNKDYSKAIQAINKCSKFKNEMDSAAYFINKGLALQCLTQTDSAIYYYNQIFKLKVSNGKQAATLHLYEIYYDKSKYKKACDYLYDCLYYTDSLRQVKYKNNADLIQELNKKISVEKENNKLKISQLNLYLLLMGVMLISSILFFIFYIKNKRRIQLLKLRKEKLEQILLQAKNTQMKSIAAINSFKNTSLYATISNLIQENKSIKMEQRKKIIEYTNQHNEHFSERLRELLPEIKDKEIFVCCLIRLSFSNAEISKLLSTTPQGISNLRKRLYIKMFKQEGHSDDLDKFLLRF